MENTKEKKVERRNHSTYRNLGHPSESRCSVVLRIVQLLTEVAAANVFRDHEEPLRNILVWPDSLGVAVPAHGTATQYHDERDRMG